MQWQTAKMVNKTLFIIYLLFYVIPFLTMLLNPKSSREFHQNLLKMCILPQAILFFIEMTQIKK